MPKTHYTRFPVASPYAGKSTRCQLVADYSYFVVFDLLLLRH